MKSAALKRGPKEMCHTYYGIFEKTFALESFVEANALNLFFCKPVIEDTMKVLPGDPRCYSMTSDHSYSSLTAQGILYIDHAGNY